MNEFRTIKVKRVLQEINIIAVVDEAFEDEDDDEVIIREQEIVLDSLRRPIPVPYSEEA